MEDDWIDTEQAKTMNIKKNEFRYATKTGAFLKRSYAYKMPLDVIHIMIKYVGFNEIKLNPHNCISLTRQPYTPGMGDRPSFISPSEATLYLIMSGKSLSIYISI